MQNSIAETLNAVLTGKERRNHEVYDAEKQSLLYRSILAEADNEVGNIRALIFELNERAKTQIDEEEKERRRQAQKEADEEAVKEASLEHQDGGDEYGEEF